MGDFFMPCIAQFITTNLQLAQYVKITENGL